MDPVLLLLICGTASALAAPIGVLPLPASGGTPQRWISWANALAAGFMLGNAIVLTEAGRGQPPAQGALGAFVGIALGAWIRTISGASDAAPGVDDQRSPDRGHTAVLVSTVHAAFEGVAIGVAMLYSVPLGIWVALSMAAHNMPEGAVLGSILTDQGVSRRDAALLAAVTNVGQVFLAISVYAVVTAAPWLFPAAVGFAVGTLLFLVMSEQLPESYAQSGSKGIAIVASIAMGVVVLVGGRGL